MNEYTEAEIERAARILCEKYSRDEKWIPFFKSVIREHIEKGGADIESALKQAKEQK